jgi:hypothetical protein
MARNRLAGTKRGTSRAARYYQENPKAREKKLRYMKEYNKRPGRQKYRALLQALNRKNGTHGNLDENDVSHTSRNTTTSEHQSKNRANKKRIFFRTRKRKRG